MERGFWPRPIALHLHKLHWYIITAALKYQGQTYAFDVLRTLCTHPRGRRGACRFNGRQPPHEVQDGIVLRVTQICVTLDVPDSV